ncbi:MAG: peptidase U32 family protein [Nanoarchaeota archaeon]|nr:peptidase U32 family protein [Nanoarchaeota archaeon]
MSKPELLSPVQDFVSLKAAIHGGANAIYFGIKGLNMRMGAKNFQLKDTSKVINECHQNKVKAYFTLNTIIYDNEMKKISQILKKLKKEKIDSIIAWDFSVIEECKKLSLKVHLSTQASISNYQSLKAITQKFKNIKRVNLARELSLGQIENIIKNIKKQNLKVEIETFVHGAMCVSVSGRCFLSQEVFGKSANRGECIQPCRRKYLVKDIEEKHEFELGEDYVMSPKDLCTIQVIDKLKKANINAFKIEGRNRSPEYVKTVTEAYREAIDTSYSKELLNKLKTAYNRGFSTGFYLGKPINQWAKEYGSKATKKKIYIGKVINFYKKIKVAEILIESNNIKLKDNIMIQGPTTGVLNQTIMSIQKDHKTIKIAKKKDIVAIKVKDTVRQNDKIFLFK